MLRQLFITVTKCPWKLCKKRKGYSALSSGSSSLPWGGHTGLASDEGGKRQRQSRSRCRGPHTEPGSRGAWGPDSELCNKPPGARISKGPGSFQEAPSLQAKSIQTAAPLVKQHSQQHQPTSARDVLRGTGRSQARQGHGTDPEKPGRVEDGHTL